jgi:thiosulfate dehydrogenase
MKYFALILLLLSPGTGTTWAASNNPADWFNDPVTGLPTWIAPDEATIPNDATGDMIRYGKKLLTETYKYLGAGSSLPYSGNRISCSNCHIDSGTSAFGTPWAVVWFKYGAGGPGPYSARSNRFLDMKNRIHDCMQRSMNGTPLPDNSYELASMIEYMKWLSTGMQVTDWNKVVGQGNTRTADLTRPADPVRGKIVYEEQCAACHQSDGGGVWDANAQKYIYPAVWGPNSFNFGAGMYRLRTGVPFVKGNMPYGWANATDPLRQLSLDDAWDVSAYVMFQDRPVWSGYLSDWTDTYTPGNCMPNWVRKNPDAGYANYFPRVKPDGTLTGDLAYPAKYTPEQHKYGPWQAMLAEQTALQNAYLAAPNTPPNCQPWP